MHTILWLVLAAALLPARVAIGQGPVSPPVDSATLSRTLAGVDAALLAAEQALDTAAVRRLLAPGFVWASPQGVIWHRGDRLAALARGSQPASQRVLREELHSLGRAVAVAVRHVHRTDRRGAEVRVHYAVQTRVYQRTGTGWTLAAQHGSLVDSAAVAADSATRARWR